MKRNRNSKGFLIVMLWVLGIGWISTRPTMASPFLQGGGQNVNQDDAKGPIKQGYVVITPTSTATAGLVGFETYGEHRSSEVTQAGVLPSEMTTHAMLFVSTSGRLSRNLGVAFANPTSSPATVTLTLRDDAGTIVASKVTSLDGGHQTARFVTELFANHPAVSKDFTGTLDIGSDVPIATVGLRFRGVNFSTLPATILAPRSPVPVIRAGVGGPAAVILAHFAAGGGWASEIVLANTSTSALTVRVDLIGSDGLPLVAELNGQSNSSFVNIPIPAGGVVILAPRNSEGDDDF